MVELTYLASTVLMGLLVVAVAIGAGRLGTRRAVAKRDETQRAEIERRALEPGETETWMPESLWWLTHSVTGWVVSFLLIAFVFTGAALLYVDPGIVGLEGGEIVGKVLVPLGAALIGGYAIGATYITARANGHSSARATAEAVTMGGVMSLVAVFAMLLT